MAFIDTPRTDAGNATYLDNGPNIEALSVENSFLSPIKKQGDLLTQLRNHRGATIKTPRMRAPFADRRNLPTAQAQAEFTPLLKSVAKKNAGRVGKENTVPQTPAFLKPGYQAKDSPALQAPESSVLYGDETRSDVGAAEEATPLPQMSSSSAQSTPMPMLPKRDSNGVLQDQGNMMTLREQENIIDKIEKENFGLKLKIHYLEESLRKSAPGFHQAALKENTELKVDKVTMQKELSKTRKILIQAERDLESYRTSLQDIQQKRIRTQEDKSAQKERELLQKRCDDQERQIDDLLRHLQDTKGDPSVVKQLKEAIEDLEADLREKDREMEAKEDDYDEKANQARDTIIELREKLENVDEDMEELGDLRETVENLQREAEQARAEAEEANEERQDAEKERQKAEDDLNELRDEMANKSFTTKGLSRQVEEKANKLEDELNSLREEHTELQQTFHSKTRELQRLEDSMQVAQGEAEVREQRLKDANELLRNERDIALRKSAALTDQVQSMTMDLQRSSEDRDVLQTRHDALRTELQSLQRELSKSQSHVHEFQQALEREKQYSLDNELALQTEAKGRMEEISDAREALQRDLEDARSNLAAKEERWRDVKRDLEMQIEKAEQKAKGLQRTVEKLQETEGTLSGQELKLQDALESETQRHRGEEALLSRQIKESQEDLANKRQSLDDNRLEILRLKEELRTGNRDGAASEDKIQALEDEIDVLQIALDEEAERATQDIAAARHETDGVRLQLQEVKQNLIRAEVATADARAEIERFQLDIQAGQGTTNQMDSRLRDLDRQLKCLREEKQELRHQLVKSHNDIELLRSSASAVEDENNELVVLRQNVATSRSKEIDYLQRETAHKDTVRQLKRQIEVLECQIHEIEVSKLAAESPSSSVNGSVRKAELSEVRRQLADSHQQMKELRQKMKEGERDSQRKVAASDKILRQQTEAFEEQNFLLEQQIASLEVQKAEQQSQLETTEKTVTRLRNRVQGLEKDLQSARSNQSDDRTIAEERKDLHEMLKDAKLEAEDLQLQVNDAEIRLQAAAVREKDLRAQLKRIRHERTLQIQKSGALSTELDNLQLRFEQKLDEMVQQQQNWEEERRSIVSRVRFPNTSVSSVHAGVEHAQLQELEAEIQKKEKKHQGELKGLAKQIQWLRAKCKREEGFRSGLAYEKKFLLLQIEMFEACNSVDLHMLEEMGVTPDKKTREKRPSLRAVGLMVIAGVRMRRMQAEWAVQKKMQASLVKKAEQMRKGSRRSVR
ncbi:hypothetical protein MMC11_001866 [Xylographa trunciseda]|nr:hypothetical protein [Xylographa trunciseda]